MMIKRYIIFTALQIIFSLHISAQIDSIRPLPPVLDLVTVNPSSGNVEITWQPSTSADVAGYVVYLYTNNAGYVLDTLDNPFPTSYIRTGSGTSYYSESYVIAALDTAGNISPLSNALNTIYTEAVIDTCNNRLLINWNSYRSQPFRVINYDIMVSVGGTPFIKAGESGAEDNSFIINDFTTATEYCFIVRANLENGKYSGSNKDCVFTRIQRPPQWINADYASIGDDNKINLSFTIDPQSEISSFRLERKTKGTADFQILKEFKSVKASLSFTDNEADNKTIYFYRLAAINSCGIPVIYSNIASNIVLLVNFKNNILDLNWNSYRSWSGITGLYILYIRTGEEYKELADVVPPDTVYSISYKDIMYDVSGEEICLMVKAFEVSNPYGVTGESSSAEVCLPVLENITVPNLFIPEGSSVKEINRYFRPVLSFTPGEYHLQITDLRRRIVFETRDYLERWDGRLNGELMPEGVYLWILRLRSPSGKSVSETGTVTLKINRQ